MLLYRSDTNKFFLLIGMYSIYKSEDSVKSYCYFYLTYQQFNRIGSVMVSVLASGLLDREFVALVERRNPSNSNYIRDVINYLKKGFPLERGICL
jgi:hypothetical protein